jgi:hypothetical protein
MKRIQILCRIRWSHGQLGLLRAGPLEAVPMLARLYWTMIVTVVAWLRLPEPAVMVPV